MPPTDGRTPDHEYPISSPMSLWLRLANNAVLFDLPRTMKSNLGNYVL